LSERNCSDFDDMEYRLNIAFLFIGRNSDLYMFKRGSIVEAI